MTQQDIFNEFTALCTEYERMLTRLDRISGTAIPGSLQVRRRDEQLYYSRNYKENGHHIQLAIPPTTQDGVQLIRDLREKRVIHYGRKVLRRNIRVMKEALRHLRIYTPETYAGRAMQLDHIALPDRDFLPGQLNVSKWIADTKAGRYEVNPYFPEDLKHDTRRGPQVRSKSEATWYDMLDEEGLLFRYDSAIRLANGRVIYADFIILHPKERRLIIVEHFGRMDDPGYAMRNMRRLQDYADSGYVLGRDLFFTLETKESPLTRAQIRATLRRTGLK